METKIKYSELSHYGDWYGYSFDCPECKAENILTDKFIVDKHEDYQYCWHCGVKINHVKDKDLDVIEADECMDKNGLATGIAGIETSNIDCAWFAQGDGVWVFKSEESK